MLVGYARVSTEGQILDRQLDQLIAHGIDKRNIYQEKITGTTKERPELKKMITELQPGDVVIVTELSRLSRSTKDIFSLVDQIQKMGADIKSLKESWIDTTTPQGKFLFTISAGVSQFERDLISQRTKEGLAAARARGNKGGRPKKDEESIKIAQNMYDSKKFSIPQILKASKLGRSTFYRYIITDK